MQRYFYHLKSAIGIKQKKLSRLPTETGATFPSHQGKMAREGCKTNDSKTGDFCKPREFADKLTGAKEW